MPAHAADGLARVQSESRISTTTWRQWCSQLGIDADDAVEVWDSVCHPMAVVSRSMPDITYVLQMRAARMGLDIEEFKEELPALLHFNAFLGGLQDEALTGKNSATRF